MPVGNDVVDLGHPLCQPDSIHPRFDSRAFSAEEIEYIGAARGTAPAVGEHGIGRSPTAIGLNSATRLSSATRLNREPGLSSVTGLNRATGLNREHRARWSLWAAKESAFKAARKIDPCVRFIPRDFAVRMSGERAEVTHRLGRFDIWFDQADEWVHAVASRQGEKPGIRVDAMPSAAGASTRKAPDHRDLAGRIPTGRGTDPVLENENSSHGVRRLAQGALADYLDLAPGEIRIVTIDGIPRAQRTTLPRGAQRTSQHQHGAPERALRLPVDLSLSHDGRFVACAWE